MYVAFKAGGKQYRALPGQNIAIEVQDHEIGKEMSFSGTAVDETGIRSAVIHVVPLEAKKADKVIIFKKKRRHNYRRKKGHRQMYLWVRISNIETSQAA